MLGWRREDVTESASELKRRGRINCVRGKIAILDARGLKAASGSCCQIVKTVYDRAQAPSR